MGDLYLDEAKRHTATREMYSHRTGALKYLVGELERELKNPSFRVELLLQMMKEQLK